MKGGNWRKRLQDAVERSDLAMRKISLRAGLSAGYLHGVLKDGKDPTVDNLIAILDVIGVSAAWVIAGIGIDPAEEKLLRDYAILPDDLKSAFLNLAEGMARRCSPDDAKPPEEASPSDQA